MLLHPSALLEFLQAIPISSCFFLGHFLLEYPFLLIYLTKTIEYKKFQLILFCSKLSDQTVNPQHSVEGSLEPKVIFAQAKMNFLHTKIITRKQKELLYFKGKKNAKP